MTKLPLLFFLFLLPISVISHLNSQRLTLLSIKHQWGNLSALSSWNPATSPCSWARIQCSSDATNSARAVTGISLHNANITSQIPPSICDLETLENLDLSWNNIPGGFPTALYGCSALTHLNLSGNLFVGPIPDDVDKLSPSLQYLDVSANNFTGNIPGSIGRLKQLKTLDLMNNLFNGTYPPEISNLSELELLQMAGNLFAPMALPPDWGKLKNLKYLFMKQCNLVGKIPQSFDGLESLQHLDLAGNGLVGNIPDGLFSLKDLEIVYLYSNELSGEIPSSVQALNLTDLDLSENKLSGSIPRGFEKLKRLRVLNLFDNYLSGEITQSIGLLPQLEYLKLYNNSLSGTLPLELGFHSALRTLEIGRNRFSGPLPENLCFRGALIGIIADSNNLSGEVPKSLGNCPTLRTLTINNNSFTGEIPTGVWTLPSLYKLIFNFNYFTGHLPDQIAENITSLEVNNNKFSGQIPSGISNWKNIQKLFAENNMLSGPLPSGLTTLSSLNTLSLERNQLSGDLPLNMNSWEFLSKLNLARNQFSGPIPSAIGTLPTLSELDLSSNDLLGEIPDQFEQLKLTVLNLSNNMLSGKIPHSLNNEAFAKSFLNNTNLCTFERSQIQTLPRCSNSFSSNSSMHLSSQHLAMILVLAVIAFSVTLWCTVFAIKRTKQRKHIYELTSWKFTPFHSLEFTEADIISSLSVHHVIGSGGSGKVYRVQVDNSGYSVAVKRIWNKHKFDNAQFLAEVETLGSIRHANIVKLLCCISSEKSKLLVYEYMENHSLDRWLHKRRRLESESRGNPLHVLDWPTRLRIAIGAAQGLCYMHHGCTFPIIHRDIKSSNILLDSDFNAKIADFGLAKTTVKQGKFHTTSNVVGSFGYFAPEYRYTRKVNEKIDVYSFGVVLLELATGKEPTGEEEGVNLAEWSSKHCCENKPIVDALDKEIVQQDYLEEMTIVFKLGLKCTFHLPNSRPSMKEVLHELRRSSLLEDDSRRLKIAGIDHVIDFLIDYNSSF